MLNKPWKYSTSSNVELFAWPMMLPLFRFQNTITRVDVLWNKRRLVRHLFYKVPGVSGIKNHCLVTEVRANNYKKADCGNIWNAGRSDSTLRTVWMTCLLEAVRMVFSVCSVHEKLYRTWSASHPLPRDLWHVT